MIPRVVSIAGSDSGGGAGIQADLKTFSAFGVYGMSVIASVTAQNTLRVHGAEHMSPPFVSLQFESILADIGVDGVKTGMLATTEIVLIVAKKLRESRIAHIVVDPVLVSTGGDALLEERAVSALRTELIPLASVVTPNLPEAERIAGLTITTDADLTEAARRIHDLGCQSVLIKGGHASGEAVDLLFDGEAMMRFRGPRLDSRNTHGTGCTLSAAILCGLVQGKLLKEAVHTAKRYVTEAIRQGFDLGKGHGPLNHFVRVSGMEGSDG